MQERVLIIGSGGREMALTLALAKSPGIAKLYVAPGADALAPYAELVDIPAGAVDELLAFAQKKEISFTIVGPEQPLSLGIADKFRAAGLDIFAPDQKAAEIECSKSFAKGLMQQYHIPTAAYQEYWDYQSAVEALDSASYPLVLKENGLCGGKGVHICPDRQSATEVLAEVQIQPDAPLIFEEFLEGFEFSLIVMAQGENFVALPTSQDYKAIYDGQKGPNTGGMGAVSPVPRISPELYEESLEHVIRPTLKALAAEGRPFTGFLYAGLMACSDGVKVIEFNARLGDPESEIILPLVDEDLFARIRYVHDSKGAEGLAQPPLVHDVSSALQEIIKFSAAKKAGTVESTERSLPPLKILPQVSLGVVLTAPGYPGQVTAHPLIPTSFFQEAETAGLEVIHMGTEKVAEGYRSKGGRVLLLRCLAPSIAEARAKVYDFLEATKPLIPDFHYRRDIGLAAQ